MGKLTIELSLIPVDAGAKAESRIAWLNIKNHHTIRMAEWSLTTLGARVKLEISVESNVYLNKLLAYPAYICSFLFGIAFSIANPDILFSPLFWDSLSSSVDTGVDTEQKPVPKAYKSVKIDFKNILVEVDESKVLDVLGKLFDWKYSIPKPRNLFEKNIRESLNDYQLALISPNIYQRFEFLYHAFEKAVNADGKDIKGKPFDQKAFALIGIADSEIEELRTFHDRIKHAFRTSNDILTMESRISNFSDLALKLKNATDRAILKRISST
ncbi:MAG: hypothetical protein ACP5SP_07785 [Caldisericum sp.]|uniref:hypothetical protein n=1 Tax=Caldisericum sp. TaxID=2499687 RepID=UPI003D09848B